MAAARPAALTAFGAMLMTLLTATSACGGADSTTVPSPERPTAIVTSQDMHLEGLSDIFVIGIDGQDLERVSASGDGAGLDNAEWSPTGEQIAASGPPCDDCVDRIAIVDMRTPSHPRYDIPGLTEGVGDPSWSPDDTSVAYVGGPTNDVLSAPVDGTRENTLIEDDRTHSGVSWSPDGRRIAFTTHRANGRSVIEVATPDGSDRRRVTPAGMTAEQPAWSPDGRVIAFARQTSGGWVVATVGARGGRVRDLTDPTQNSQQPAWSPDGRVIAFTTITGPQARIAIMNSDGSNRRTFATGTPSASAPSWSPDGTRIAFTVRP